MNDPWARGRDAVIAQSFQPLASQPLAFQPLGREKEKPLAAGRDSAHLWRDIGRCVVLSHGDDVSRDFLASLSRNGVDVIVIGQPVTAFVELTLLDRQRPRSEWGLAPSPRVALVIADRERWGNLEPLLSAVRRHLPEVSVWVGASELWVEVTSPPAGEQPEHATLPDLPPTLHLSGHLVETVVPVQDAQVPAVAPLPSASASIESRSAPEPPPSASRNRPPMSTAVTAEEIEMLLRLFPNDESDDRNPNPDSPRLGS